MSTKVSCIVEIDLHLDADLTNIVEIQGGVKERIAMNVDKICDVQVFEHKIVSDDVAPDEDDDGEDWRKEKAR